MKRIFSAVLFVFVMCSLSACNDQQRAALTGIAVGVAAGTLIAEEGEGGHYRDHRYSYRHCNNLHGYTLAQCRCDLFHDCRALDRYNNPNNRYYRRY